MAEGTVLVAVAERPEDGGAAAGQLTRIAEGIRARDSQVRWVVSVADAETVLRTEAGLAAAVVAWDLCQEMHDRLREARLVELLDTAFQQALLPHAPPGGASVGTARPGSTPCPPGPFAALLPSAPPPGAVLSSIRPA
ncbi:hypothetical protein ABTX62_22890 [Streptomyces sp. NPDC096046]|uniref:hypothetical protein n=1 Tax=Streptomyces sp. NPDC096046 TaxID=3155542 RepID=UPI0033338944